ncbi:MAG TPA: hypothetical protein VE008_07340 [Burkholderiales bacterium]|nr:hypothetical protein [Burkholderiales bacterium]
MAKNKQPDVSAADIADRWHRRVQDLAAFASSAEVDEQVLTAVAALPDTLGTGALGADRDSAIDKWFQTHFHKAPVSYNTRLFNTLHAAKEELKAMLSAVA